MIPMLLQVLLRQPRFKLVRSNFRRASTDVPDQSKTRVGVAWHDAAMGRGKRNRGKRRSVSAANTAVDDYAPISFSLRTCTPTKPRGSLELRSMVGRRS